MDTDRRHRTGGLGRFEGPVGRARAVLTRLDWLTVPVALAAAAGFATLSVRLLLRAVEFHQLGDVLPLVGLGGLVGAVGLWFAGWPVVLFSERAPALAGWMGVAAVAAGGALMVIAFDRSQAVVAAVATVVMMVGVLLLDVRRRTHPLPAAGLFTLFGIALLVAGWVGLGNDGAPGPMASVALGLGGLVLIKLALPVLLAVGDLDDLAPPLTIGGLLASAAGVVAAMRAAEQSEATTMLAGFGAVVGGLTLVGIAGVRLPRTVVWPVWNLLLGATLLYVGVTGARAVLGEWSAVVYTLIAFLVGLGASFVWRGEGIVALVLLGFVVTWVLVDRTVDAPSVPADGGLLVVVGDSYAAGQGGDEFFAGTNNRGVPGANDCRRAPDAFGELVGERLGLAVVSRACSGATIARTVGLDADGDPVPPGTVDDRPSQLDQLRELLGVGGRNRVEIVLLTLGGNDAGFGTIVRSCLLPSDCSERSDDWIRQAGALDAHLAVAYAEIARTFPRAQVVAVPYPLLLDEERSCALALDPDRERPFIASFQRLLRASVIDAAEAAGPRVSAFSDGFEAYRATDRFLCDRGREGTNFVQLTPYDGPVAVRLNPVNWVDGSLHPRDRGHQAIAEALVPWLGAGRERVGRGEPFERPQSGGADDRTLSPGEEAARTAGTGGFDVVTAEREQITAGLFTTARRATAPVAMLFAAGLLLALGLIQASPLLRHLLVTRYAFDPRVDPRYDGRSTPPPPATSPPTRGRGT